MTGWWPRSFACRMVTPALAGRAPHSSQCIMWTRSPSSTADNDLCSLDLRYDYSLKSWLCLITLEIRDSWQPRLLTWISKRVTLALWHILIRGTSNRGVFSCCSMCKGEKVKLVQNREYCFCFVLLVRDHLNSTVTTLQSTLRPLTSKNKTGKAIHKGHKIKRPKAITCLFLCGFTGFCL